MSFHVAERVQQYRANRRAAGLRLVQIWVPGTRRPDFAEECRRQSRAISQADAADTELLPFMDEILSAADSWAK